MTDTPEHVYGRVGAAVGRFRRKVATRGGGPAIRLTITDDSRERARGLDRVFVGLGATIDDFPDALRAALPTIRAEHRRVFTSEGSSGRGKWAPLAPATRRQRARLGYPPAHPIQVRSGALRDHVLNTPAQITRTPGGFELRIAPSPTVAGDGKRKYRLLALGGYTPTGGRVPGRPMVALGPAAANRVTSSISRSLRESAYRHGLR